MRLEPIVPPFLLFLLSFLVYLLPNETFIPFHKLYYVFASLGMQWIIVPGILLEQMLKQRISEIGGLLTVDQYDLIS